MLAIARVYVFLFPSIESPLVKSTESILRGSTVGKRWSKLIAYVKSYSTWKANLIVSLSLACMAICFVSYNKYTLFPGINALPIKLATVGIIYAHVKAGFLHAVLANRVCQFIGNISYSLYLWHWPVIVFFKLQFLGHYTYTDMAVVFTVSMALAIGTYYFIEVPFRKVNISNYQKRYLAGSALISAILAIFILLSIPIQNAPFPKKPCTWNMFQIHQ